MIRNYVKTAWRMLRKHTSYTLINIFGLAVSMSICLLIILFIWDQKSYDQFHTHKDRIVRLTTDRMQDTEVSKMAATPAPLATALLQEGTGIERAARLGQIRTNAIHKGKALSVTGLYAEPSFFTLFDFPLDAGAAQQVLHAPFQMVLSANTATKFFGNTDPVGQSLTLEGIGDVTVTGIIATDAGKSHLKFDMLVSFSTIAATAWKSELDDWSNFHRFATYLLLSDRHSLSALQEQLDRIARRQYGQASHQFEVQALTDITLGELYSNEISSYSLPRFVMYFLIALGLVVLLAACFNYVSLTIARSLHRAKEVGVRKVVGAQRSQIIIQLLAESVIIALLSLFLAYGLVAWLLSGFNSLAFHATMDARISPSALFEGSLVLSFFSFSILVGLLAGIYPAVYLSSFRVARVLKGVASIRGFSGLTLRRLLIVVQLTFSLVFIITTVLLYNQFNYIVEKDYGFRSDHILNVELQGVSYDLFREELLRQPGVVQVSATSRLPASGSTNSIQFIAQNTDTLDGLTANIDPHFLDNLDLPLLAGRTFSPFFATDSSEAFVINETAVRTLGLGTPQDALGRTIEVIPIGEGKIIGVVQDYQHDLLTRPIGPLALRYRPGQFRFANIRTLPNTDKQVAAALEASWKNLDPVHSLDYAFFEAQLRTNPLTRLFQEFLRIIGLVTGITLLIACLGLFSMAAYNAETRTKEVGVRKVLGASLPGLLWLLSREFAVLMLMATLLAIPLAYLPNQFWLNNFANHVDFGFGIFAISMLAMLALALVTVGSQSLKAALANPVESLQYE